MSASPLNAKRRKRRDTHALGCASSGMYIGRGVTEGRISRPCCCITQIPTSCCCMLSAVCVFFDRKTRSLSLSPSNQDKGQRLPPPPTNRMAWTQQHQHEGGGRYARGLSVRWLRCVSFRRTDLLCAIKRPETSEDLRISRVCVFASLAHTGQSPRRFDIRVSTG